MTNANVITEPFRELLESLPDGVVVVSAGGEIVAVNTQACALSGYLPGELVGARIEMLVPASHRAEHVALRSAYVISGGSLRPMSQRLDIVLVRADQTSVPVDIGLYANEWGARVLMRGESGRLGQVTPPVWRSTRSR